MAYLDYDGLNHFYGKLKDTFAMVDNPSNKEYFKSKTWTYSDGYTGTFTAFNTWTDGDNIYLSNGSSHQYILDKTTLSWTVKTWTGASITSGSFIWTDGDNIYYSNSSNQYVLNKSTSTWTEKTWNGLTSFSGSNIWTDGVNIYYSSSSTQYVLNKLTSTWTEKTWNGLTNFGAINIWTDGDNIYYSYYSDQYVLDKATSTWTVKSWGNLISFPGSYVWTDGKNFYYSSGSSQFVLNKATSTWNTKIWNGITPSNGQYIWSDGDTVYYSYSSDQYVLYFPDKMLVGKDELYTPVDAENYINSFVSNIVQLPQKLISAEDAATITSVSDFTSLLDGPGRYIVETNSTSRTTLLSIGLIPENTAGILEAIRLDEAEYNYYLNYRGENNKRWFATMIMGICSVWQQAATKSDVPNIVYSATQPANPVEGMIWLKPET